MMPTEAYPDQPKIYGLYFKFMIQICHHCIMDVNYTSHEV